ncbi:MAG: flagellar hook-associated protein FlgL [Proteobacteria bacterium]|nr:flagellar hook-associated protein FlgL [Pseudomonadota bacterium]
MRITNKGVYDSIKYNLGKITEEMNKANEITSSGKRITDLSDDPVGLTQALKLKSAISGIDQLGRNVSLGNSWLAASESALTSVQDLISDTKSLCVQMASSTSGASERASAATTIQNTIDEILSLANTEVSGRYIFSGTKTDSQAFDQSGTYLGNNESFAVKIGTDTTMNVGRDGSEVFGTIFADLTDLKNDLLNNNIGGIQSSLDDLTVHFNNTTNTISDIGSKMNRMEIKEQILQDLDIVNTDRLSVIEDADIADAIIKIKELEVAYQAALSSSSKIMQLSLVDYLK